MGWLSLCGIVPGGHSFADVAAVQMGSAELLIRYYDAVHEPTLRFVTGLIDADLARAVDDYWDPPVTLGVGAARDA